MIETIKEYKANEKHFNWHQFEYKNAIEIKSDLDNTKHLEGESK